MWMSLLRFSIEMIIQKPFESKIEPKHAHEVINLPMIIGLLLCMSIEQLFGKLTNGQLAPRRTCA